MREGSLSCWQCGTVLSTAGGRCPACGAEQPPGASPVSRRASAWRESIPDEPPHSKALPWVALVVGLAVIGGGAVLLRPRNIGDKDARTATSGALANEPSRAAPADVGALDLRAVDPMDVLGRVKTRALAWSKDAVLVSMRARPVAEGRVDVQGGGSVEYWFAKPTGEGFGPGMKVAGKRLHIAVESTGTRTEETAGGPARAALEPNCPLDAAAHAAQAAGVSPPFTAAYEMADKLAQKPTWRIASDGKESDKRQIDGLSCAVLVR